MKNSEKKRLVAKGRFVDFFVYALLFVFLISLFSFKVSSDYSIDKNITVIQGEYFEGDFVKGQIKMSFSEQKNKNFTSNFGGGISLIDLLESMGYNAGNEYICDPLSCKNDYDVVSSGSTNKSFLLSGKEFYGFKITGDEINSIDTFRFNLTSDVGLSCANQISIDLLSDNKIDFTNTKYFDSACGTKNYGCFIEDANIISGTLIIGEGLYCEKIGNLAAAPAYRIGAKIEKGSTQGELTMRMYRLNENLTGSFLKKCTITPTSSGEHDCIVSYLSKESFDAYVCINAEPGTSGTDYKIRARQADNSCGGRIAPTEQNPIEFIADYEIYAQPLKYDEVGETEIKEQDLTKIKNYLQETYDSKCSAPKGCIIPFSLQGNSQQISLSNGLVKYSTAIGSPSTSDFLELGEREFTISSNDTILDIEKMRFLIPAEEGAEDSYGYDFYLCFDEANCNEISASEGKALASESITVRVGFPFTLGPKTVLVGRRTTFTAFGSENILSSRWNFGDNSQIINSNDNTAQHTYNDPGEYLAEVTLTSSAGESSTRKFKINVGDAKTSATLTIREYESRISNVKSSMNNFPEWTQEIIKEETNIEEAERSLESIKNEFDLLGNDASEGQYVEIVDKLLALVIPNSVSVTESGELPAAVGYENINQFYIGEISDEEVSDSAELKNSIINWMDSNYNVVIEFETISQFEDLGKKNILKRYKINIEQLADESEFSYLIIAHPFDKIKFRDSYNERTIDGDFSYISIDEFGQPDSIEFLIKESAPSIEELGVYISPTVDSLDVGGFDIPCINLAECLKKDFRTKEFIIGIFMLFALFLIVYLFLQHWYKKYYERHLFKNSDDLYNLVGFIYNGRRAGVSDVEAKRKLLEKNWTREQLHYAFKKIDGKRTTMLEIPMFKFMENKKVRRELEKRHGPIDTRFIKQRYY